MRSELSYWSTRTRKALRLDFISGAKTFVLAA